METQPPVTNSRPNALRGIVPLVAFTICLTLAAGYFFYRTYNSVRENAFEPAIACTGLPVAGTAAYESGPGLKPALAYRQLENEEWVLDTELLLSEWRANDTGKVQIIVCLGQQEALLIPACDGSGELIYGYQLALQLVEAAAGAVLNETTLSTATPPAETCLDAAPANPRLVSNGEINNYLNPLLDVR